MVRKRKPAPEVSGNRVAELSEGLEIWRSSIDDLKEQDKNARTMPKRMFGRLAQTIKGGQRLESLPFCAATDKGLEIISGHHRIRASRDAGLKEVFVIVDISGLTPSQIKSKQLAHNAIQGADDYSLLSQIYSEIDNIDDLLETFIDIEAVTKALETGSTAIADIRVAFDWKMMLISFLPSEFDDWENLIKMVKSMADNHYVADMALYSEFNEVLDTMRQAYDARSVSTCLATMMAITKLHLGITDDRVTIDKEWIALVDIFRAIQVPKAAATVITRALEDMKHKGVVSDKNLWQALELWAADYLAGE